MRAAALYGRSRQVAQAYLVCLPKLRKADPRPLVAFARPQDMRVSDHRESGEEIEATVVHLHLASPMARLELESLWPARFA
jgi:hypothetical protein